MNVRSFFEPRTADEQQAFEEQLRSHTARYHKLGLEKNPFPLGGNYPDASLDYTYLEQRKESRIKDFLVSTFVRGEFNGLLVIGEYGAGKSHILHYMRDIVLTDPFFGKQALCFLIQNPSVAPEDILLSMLREVKLGVVQDLVFAPVARRLEKEYAKRPLQFLQQFTNFKPQATLDEVTFNPGWYRDLFFLSYREFVKRLNDQAVSVSSPPLKQYALAVLREELEEEEDALIQDLAGLVFASDSEMNRSWETFLSGRLMKKGSLGVEYYLHAFLELFRLGGVRHVYLLVDEIEDLRTQRLSNKAATEYLATLRRMIQHNYRMFSFVLACTRDAWGELKRLYPAIEDRFPITIDLLPDTDEVKRILQTYLSRERLPDSQPGDSWAPFTEAAVDRIIEGRGRVLRHVLTEMRGLVDEAVRDDTRDLIDKDFVEKYASFGVSA